MAVLYRTNSQSRALEEAFRRAGIPYRLVGAISFYERREVKDLLAYLRLVANPADDEAFLRAVGGAAARPRRHQPRDARPAGAPSGGSRCSRPLASPIACRISVPMCAKPSGTSPASSMDPGSGAGRLPPAEMLEQIIRAIDYEAMLHAEGPEGADRWENVRELIASAADWSEEVDRGCRGRHRRSSASSPRPRCSPRPTTWCGNESGVTLMTLHTAKGLEWPVVVLTGLEDGLFPLARARGAAGRAGGGAPALLRGSHPGQGQALPDLGTRPAPRR